MNKVDAANSTVRKETTGGTVALPATLVHVTRTLEALGVSEVPPPSLHGRAQVVDPSEEKNREEELLPMLMDHIQAAQQATYGIEGKEVVLVIGNTGSGKSTFINYLAGRRFEKADTHLRANVKCEDPLSSVGHTNVSCTSLPEIHPVDRSGLMFCDCPGFFDNRGVLSEIANAVSLSRVAKESRAVKCVILCIEYASLISTRGEGMNKAIQTTKDFLGSNIPLDSVFLLITKGVGEINNPTEALNELASESSVVKELQAKGNVGFYSPMDDFKADPCVYSRGSMRSKIQQFAGIEHAQDTFKITLDDSAIAHIRACLYWAQKKIIDHIKSGKSDALDPISSLMEAMYDLKDLVGSTIAMRKDFKQLEDTLCVQIQLLGNQDDAEPRLEELLGILPGIFAKTIRDTLGSLHDRLDKKKKDEEAFQKQSEVLKNFEQMNDEMKLKLDALSKDLSESKITEAEYQERIQKLHEIAEQSKTDKQKADKVIETLIQQQQTEKEQRDKEIADLKSKIQALVERPPVQQMPSFSPDFGGISESYRRSRTTHRDSYGSPMIRVRSYDRSNGTHVHHYSRRK